MSLQCQTINFTIPGDGSYAGGPQIAQFTGNVTNGAAWVAIQSINVSYSDGEKDHNRGVNLIEPSVVGVSATEVKVDLQFKYADRQPNFMSGSVQILVIADVS